MKFSRNHFKVLFCIITLSFIFCINNSLAESGNPLFLRSAKKCHDYINNNNFYYSKGVEIPLDRTGNRRVDCSSYVSWVICDYTDGRFSGSKNSSWFYHVAKDLSNGRQPDEFELTSTWEVITDSNNFLPGDILCYRNHVQIYAGQNDNGEYLVYNAGNDESINENISVITDNYFHSAKYALRLP